MDSRFPTELLEHVFSFADLLSLPNLCRASKSFRAIVEESYGIWRSRYLETFDNPIPTLRLRLRNAEADNYDWKTNLKWRFRAEIVLNDFIALQRSSPCQRVQVYRTLVDVALTALPHDDTVRSKNISWLRRVYDKGHILHHDSWAPSAEELQARSWLHVLVGVTNVDIASPNARYTSREYVYNFENYTAARMYGPYSDYSDESYHVTTINGSPRSLEGVALEIRVNWTHLRHIHHVFNMNYLERVPFTDSLQISSANPLEYDLVRPMNLSHIRADSAPSNLPGIGYGTGQDWPGVEGRWSCAFCFCDHRVLMRFNQYLRTRSDPDFPAMLNPFEDPNFGEALRSLDVDFKILAIGKVPEEYPYPDRPPVHFRGRIILAHDNELDELEAPDANMIGTVTMTGDREIRWSFTSGEDGNVVWSSEGIQVGGLRSAYGVLGAWTTVFHGDSDPVGPFWLRKRAGRTK